jgi:hypothetical protein
MITPFSQALDPMTRASTFFGRLLFRLSGRLRCRIIPGNQGEPYLERYHLLRLPGGGGVYVHRFLDSDPDRGLHDHPWRHAIGLVLAGGYVEQRLVGDTVEARLLRPGRLNRLSGNDFHRIVLPGETEAWTLFLHTGNEKDWGFLSATPQGERRFVPHEAVNTEGSHRDWWKTAPRGRHAARQPLALKA